MGLMKIYHCILCIPIYRVPESFRMNNNNVHLQRIALEIIDNLDVLTHNERSELSSPATLIACHARVMLERLLILFSFNEAELTP